MFLLLCQRSIRFAQEVFLGVDLIVQRCPFDRFVEATNQKEFFQQSPSDGSSLGVQSRIRILLFVISFVTGFKAICYKVFCIYNQAWYSFSCIKPLFQCQCFGSRSSTGRKNHFNIILLQCRQGFCIFSAHGYENFRILSPSELLI